MPPPATARLIFRTGHRQDVPLALALWGDPEVMRLLGGPYTETATRERIDAEIAFEERLGFQYWPIFLSASGAHVGCCGLRPREASIELGFHLHRAHWGQGLALEAARGALQFAAKEHGLKEIGAGHHPENQASRRVLEKLGFERSGETFYAPTGLMHPWYLRRLP